ncbi:glycoside hydrolase family 7 protein [Neurospora crassa]|uniref:Glucanase n=1 Tax=Neurospora crassa (strain ATCC 24698 / 74-OR23-1A / CBS 708.71 / DSM 1257 / FGSC 987) TaxID=367110 RepID=Q7RXC7_NEUCR|nr:endoglucanase EG-1 [Neurospora crassa OR74A]EAA27195.1 endoglucanase EG-1 [Neurospora crassa OR74A]KHE83841.1 glycoside hydrolase family 7 protein [Neurospora crassa]|eukprot:XP_956431.1 endoglucanase EG-1 [Neurospora crassa OR74A]
MVHKLAFLTGLTASLVSAQQIGTITPESHPKLPTKRCTLSGGCQTVSTSIVLDAFQRPLHKIGDPSTACVVGGPLCPDAATCAANCALEGVDYASLGVKTEGDALTLNQWVSDPSNPGHYKTSSPRTYLVAEDGKNYEAVKLLGKEISFDVDVSNLPCGMNGAFYLSEMLMDGGRGEFNAAGAEYGTGYCDAQCPKLDFINGEANINKTHGACCNEMDIFEANARAKSFTPHPCSIERVYKCTGDTECGQSQGVCDQWGCTYNEYQKGVHDFYGLAPPAKTIDTTQKFTVTTQFLTDNGREDGVLVEIRRLWSQNGKLIKNAKIAVDSLSTDSVSTQFCEKTSSWTMQRGGLKTMGEAMGRGMVLIFSIWADESGFMNWLDSGDSGPCSATEGDPKLILQKKPDARVTFSNIKWGEMGSTYASAGKYGVRRVAKGLSA